MGVMRENRKNTTPEAWREWKKRCAAGLCGAETAAQLRRFGSVRFATYVKKYAAGVGRFDDNIRPAEIADGWHLFETHARTAGNRAGKRYKDWLFERVNGGGVDFVAAIEAGVTLMMRDVVREHLRSEHAPAFMTSLQKPVGSGDGSTCTLEDLLPDHLDPATEAAEREWCALAARHTADFMASLDERQATALWGRARGVSFSDAGLRQRAGCSADVLHKTYQRLMHQLGDVLKAAYPGESPSALTHLACMIHADLVEKISEKYFVQNDPAHSFSKL